MTNGWVNPIGMDDMARLYYVSSAVRLIFLRVYLKHSYIAASYIFIFTFCFYGLDTLSIRVADDGFYPL